MHQSIHLAVTVRHEEADDGRCVDQAGVPRLPVLGGHAPRLLTTDQPLDPGGGEARPGDALGRHRLPD